jgi:hypothetical protein
VMDVLAFVASGQVDVLHEHVARVRSVALARVGATAAAPTAQVEGHLIAVTRVIVPSWIEHRPPPS